MSAVAFIAGVVVGIIASMAYNYFKPKSFDKVTDKTARKIREKM